MASNKSAELFDTIIVGGHLTGLLTARALELLGQRVAILEGSEVLGGALRPIAVNSLALPTNLALVPSSVESAVTLRWLEELIQCPVVGDTVELAPLTFDDGTLKNFWGFGSRQFSSLNVISRYNQSCWTRLQSTPDQWVRTLIESFRGETLTRALVTEYAFAEPGLALTLNGARTIYGRQVIYTLSPRSLLQDLPLDLIPGRTRQRLAKTPLWTSVHLHLAHSSIQQESEALHFLYGAKDDMEPTIGRFFAPKEGLPGQRSLWLGLLPTELADDPEQIANTLREMRRQLRRAYPEAFSDLRAEKIVIDFNSHGNFELGLKDPGLLPELPTLFIAHPTMDPQVPLVAAVSQAQAAINWCNQARGELGKAPLEPQLL